MDETSPAAGRVHLAQFAKPERLRGFWALFVTQFQGAFSDNLYKFLVIFIILSMEMPKESRDQLVPLVMALFALPFILFSMAGGYLADRYSKRSVAIATKVAEIAIMCLAAGALATEYLPLLLVVVFLMSTQSAFFGPTKYGLLPELLPEQKLSWGNGTLSLGTFVAIITGTMAAGKLSEMFHGQQMYSGLILVALACFGTWSSLYIDRLPPANPTKRFQLNIVGDLFQQIRIIRRDRVLFLSIIGANYFWFLGALLQPNIQIYGKDILHLPDAKNTFLQAALSIGIGVGSFAAGYLSGKKIEYGLIPLGSVGLTVASGLLGQPNLTFTSVLVLLACVGFAAGFYIVPMNALIQHRPERGMKGSVIATSALLSFIGVFLAAGVYYLLIGPLRMNPSQVFLTGSVLTLAATAYIVWLLPDSLLRLLFWFLTHTIYRIRVEGRENIPERGGALFVCNHLSLVDAFLLLASTDRHVRFLMFKGMYERPWIKPFARMLRVIPISSQLRPREMIHALREASASIRNGEIVCIFAEGQITRIGQMLPFRRGFERIMEGVDAPIIPVSLDGVWGSIFSFEQGRFFWKWPRRIPYPVTVSFGTPMPPTATALEVREVVQTLNAEAWKNRKKLLRTLHRSFLSTARRHPFRFAMTDLRSGSIRFGTALLRSVFLARRLAPFWAGQKMVGILLPPSIPAALVNFAALFSGRIPVNLNYTGSDQMIASCVEQCGIRTIISSKAFLGQVKLSLPVEPILLETLAERPSRFEQLAAALLAFAMPGRLLERRLSRGPGAQIDDLATIIFSSGSTGDPKGVMLTHFNIAANVEQLGQMFSLGPADRILGVLPFFHSFGFTGTISLPATLGVGVVYHFNPLDAKSIGQLVEEHRVTLMLATPTFLQLYLRGCAPEQFGSLQYVLVGAEKLPDRLTQAFEENFGIRPLEAYGCTECAPAVTVNTRDYRAPGLRQVGAKRGKIGHPLPGISIQIVDPQTGQHLPIGQPGLLLVRGPNVMKGYLNRPEKTAEAFRDGYYVTGDIATVDEDGFIEITDRLSRFSKIGGEMVPHIKVEEKLHEAAGLTEQSFAVTGIPDERKGERLVVLHKLAPEPLHRCLESFARSDLPNLWKPRADQFVFVESLPYLGTGKLDLRKIREIASQAK